MATASEKLVAKLAEKKRSQSWLADQMGVRGASVSLWCRGHSRPEPEHRLELERIIKLDAAVWFTPAERLIAKLPEDQDSVVPAPANTPPVPEVPTTNAA